MFDEKARELRARECYCLGELFNGPRVCHSVFEKFKGDLNRSWHGARIRRMVEAEKIDYAC